MKKFMVALLLFFGTFHAFAHEGEVHEPPASPAIQHPKILETTRTVTQKITGEKGTYNLAFLIKPAQPMVGIEIQIEVKVTRLLPNPDPLLGSEIPIEGGEITGTFVARKYSTGSMKAHPEEEPGVFGLHKTFDTQGSYELQLEVKTPDDSFNTRLPFQVNLLPGTALVRKIDFVILILGVTLALGMFFCQIRKGQTVAEKFKAWLPGFAGILFIGGISWGIFYYLVAPRLNAPYEERASSPLTLTETKNPDIIEVSQEVRKLLGINTTPVKLSALISSLDLPGKVTAPSQAVHEIHSPVIGRVESGGHIPTLGEHVQKGQILAVVKQTLTAPEQLQVQLQNLDLQKQITQVQIGLAETRTRLSLKTKEVERARKLYEIQAIALKDLQLAEAEYQSASLEFEGAQRQENLYEQYKTQKKTSPSVALFPINAPVRGVITAMDLTHGEIVNPEKKLFLLMDLSTVWIQAHIYEKDLEKVQIGDHADIRIAALPKRRFQGKLKTLASVVDPQSRTIQAIFEIPNPDRKLRDGMLAMVHLKTFSRSTIAVRGGALIEEEGNFFVFVEESPISFRRRPVTLGVEAGEQVEITKGLIGGELVVTEGAHSLASQAKKQGQVHAK